MEEILSTDVAEAGTVAEENVESSVLVDVIAAEDELVPQKKKRRHINQQKLQDNIWGWIFCIPLLVGTIWFVYSAFVMAVMLSFTNFEMSGAVTLGDVLSHMGDYVYKESTLNPDGTLNLGAVPTPNPFIWYQRVFTTNIASEFAPNEMGIYLFNTVFYMIGIPIGMILSMFFAVCMSRDIKGGNVFRVLYYIPCVASTISIVYTFKIMFSTSGVINQMFGSTLDWLNPNSGLTWNKVVGSQSTSAFMADPYWCQGFVSKLVIVIMSVWKGLGGTIILYVAGLSGVNAATKEAAQIDGANGWQIFWKVTMPDLYPTIFYNIVTSVIGGMQIYAEPVLLFGEHYNTSGYVSLVYIYGLNTVSTPVTGGNKNPSAGAAYGMILAVFIFVMTLFQFWLDSRKKD